MSSLHNKIGEVTTLFHAFQTLHKGDTFNVRVEGQNLNLKNHNNQLFNMNEMFWILTSPFNMDMFLTIIGRYHDQNNFIITIGQDVEFEDSCIIKLRKNVKFFKTPLIVALGDWFKSQEKANE